MAERRPLVLKDGRVQELPTGDTVVGGGGGEGGGSVVVGGEVSNLPNSKSWRVFIKDSNYRVLTSVEFRSVVGATTIPTGGLATASDIYGGGYEASKAFDGDPTTIWHSGTLSQHWIRYDHVNPITVREVMLQARNSGQATEQGLYNFEIQYLASDNATWLPIIVVDNAPAWGNAEVRTYLNPTEESIIHRIPDEAPQDGTPYNRQDAGWVPAFVPEEDPGLPVKYKFWRAEAMTADNTGFTSIADFRFRDEVGAEITPYTATATSPYSGYPLSNAFDANGDSFYAAAQANVFIQLEYPEPVSVSSLAIRARDVGNETPNVATIRVSNDGLEWSTVAVLDFKAGVGWAGREQRIKSIPVTYYTPVYIEEAPDDGQAYVRVSKAWVLLSSVT